MSITQRGLAAIQVDEGGAQSKARKPARVGKRPISRLCKETRAEAPQRSAKPHRGESKQARVIAMLQSRQGATIAAIMKATGWQPHSVRGFLTAVVRNKLGLTLVSEKTGEQRVYRIMAKAAPARRGSNPGAKAA